MRTQTDVSADKPNLQTIDEQNVTASGECGDGVGKDPTDANVTEFKCKHNRKKKKLRSNTIEGSNWTVVRRLLIFRCHL